MVEIKDVVRVVGATGMRMGVPLEPWSSRRVREGVCNALTRLEDAGARGIRDVRRRLESELWP